MKVFAVLLGVSPGAVSSFRGTFTLAKRRPPPDTKKQCAGAMMTRIYSSIISTPSLGENSSTPSGPVLLQKILRTSGDNDMEFLGSVVGWLQDVWELPTDLPIVYEKQLCEGHEKDEKNRAVITWNSALSPNAAATALHVDVMAVYPEAEGGDLLSMVVLYKEVESARTFDKIPPMLQNLFKNSQQKIVNDLDRALADWQTQLRKASTSEWDKVKYDMLGELMEDSPHTPNRSGALDEGIAAVGVATSERTDFKTVTSSTVWTPDFAVRSAQQDFGAVEEGIAAAGLFATSERTDFKTAPSSTVWTPDFAVRSAQQEVQNRRKEDFAVEAARQMARHRNAAQGAETREKESMVESPAATSNNENDTVDPRQWQIPSLSNEALSSRTFFGTISRPMDYAGRIDKRDERSSSSPSSRSGSITTGKDVGRAGQEELRKDSSNSSRKLNVVSKVEIESEEKKRLRLANEALDEVVQSTDDLSATEMVEAVMRFGQETKKKETVGDGFASGAFGKAKELLKEQHRRKEGRLRQNAAHDAAKHFSGISPNISLDDTVVSAEEELRRMFQAGEKLAKSRIIAVEPANQVGNAHSIAGQQQLIDDIVAADREISSHARVLDDELVELEVRINKSPEMMIEGRDPDFDIFSGPEMYNPNVSPETSVNWPGALPGTKTTTRLPCELNEAVEQARFAASVLSNLKQEGEEYFVGKRQFTENQVQNMRAVVTEASSIGLVSDPLEIMNDRSRLQMVIDELQNQPKERFRAIIGEYKDILLSEHFVFLVKERLQQMAERDVDGMLQDDPALDEKRATEREILGDLVAYAQLLLKEASALGAELEAQQLEVIRSICKVAMDPSLNTEEETAAALSDAVSDMRPLFDDAFIAYLKYAVAEEEARLARAGVLDDPDHAKWLYVLKIVQQGVHSEISRGISRYIDHIWYILRMETPKERRMLLSEIIDALPALDVRPFVQVVENISGALGESVRGEFDDDGDSLKKMTNKILQLHRDLQVLLPPDRIVSMSRDADEWAKRSKEKLQERRNLTKERLKAARETEHLDEDIISALGQKGETERFD